MVVGGHINVDAGLRQLTRLGYHSVFAKDRKETGTRWAAELERGFEDEIMNRRPVIFLGERRSKKKKKRRLGKKR